jgi:hypothetical protein
MPSPGRIALGCVVFVAVLAAAYGVWQATDNETAGLALSAIGAAAGLAAAVTRIGADGGGGKQAPSISADHGSVIGGRDVHGGAGGIHTGGGRRDD